MNFWKRLKTKWAPALLLLAVVAVLLPAGGFVTSAEAAVTTTASWTQLSSNSTTGYTIGTSGSTTYYYITANRSFTNSTAGGSGLTIAGTVYLYIPSGVTLTATGAAASGTTGGGAGIHVPSGATLYLFGDGTVKATGGAAAQGSTGGNGGSAASTTNLTSTSGAGGNGGGGAGAGIGTPGGSAGTGGIGSTVAEQVTSASKGTLHTKDEKGLAAGNAGGTANACGTIYKSSSLNVSGVKGGAAAAANTNVSSDGTDNQASKSGKFYCASGGGGGGTGGSGLAGAAFGTGGGGGGGGASGGTGQLFAGSPASHNAGTRGGNGAGNGQTAGSKGGAAGAAATSKTPGTSSGPSYTVTYTPASGTATSANYNVGSNTKLVLPAQTGYAWQLTTWGKSCGSSASEFAGSSSTRYTPSASITLANVYGDLAFKATPITYTIKFNANNGSGTVPGNISATYNVNVTMPANPFSRTGYTFGGWNTQADGKGTNYTASTDYKNLTTTDGATVNLYAKWTANTYKVTFDKKSGTGGSDSVTATYDSNMPTATMPTRTGYTFQGYQDAESGGTQYYTSAGASARTWNKTANTILYARWTPITYTVKYDLNGGTGSAPVSTTAAYDVVFPVENTSATKTGYTFKGWSTSKTATTATYTAGSTGINLTTTNGATVTLYAVWAEKTATLTYNANGHGTAPGSVTMKYTAATNAASAITATGYTFNGWNTKSDGKGTPYAAGGQVKAANVEPSATTLYAQWKEKTATLYYYNNGHGTAPSSATMKYTAATNAASALTATGYTFGGWNTKSDGSGTDFAAGATVKKANVEPSQMSLYAKWTANKYTIKFDVNGGSSAVPKDISATYDANVTMPAAATRTGYTFGGWNTNANGTGNNYNASAATKNLTATNNATVTLFAKWTPITYTVAYDLNGGTGTAPGDTSATYDVSFTMPNPSTSKTGYTFKGWSTSSDATSAAYDAGTSYKNIRSTTGTTTLYAVWTANTYTVTFDKNGGEAEADPKTRAVTYDGKYVLPTTNPTRTGYTFAGWFTAEGGGDEVTANTTVKITAAQTLYAHWTVNRYTVTFNANEHGTAPNAETVDYGTTLTRPADLTETGYTFGGWYKESACENAWDFDTDTVAGDTTLYAKWTVNTYNVTLNTDGADDCDELTGYTYGVGAALPTPVRTGYTFGGWFDNAGFDGNAITSISATDTGDKTFYAKWTANTYTVEFNANGGTGAPDNIAATYDEAFALPAEEPTRTGYVFGGWNTKEAGTGNTYEAGTEVSNLTAENGVCCTLYAMWEPAKYDIIYKDAGGADFHGNTAGLPTQHTYDTETALVNTTRTGYKFGGWFTDEECATTPITVLGATDYTADITLYAKWTPITYTIKFGKNDFESGVSGSGPSSITVAYDEAFALPTSGYRKSYNTLTAWTTNPGSGTSYAAGETKAWNLTTTDGAEITLYAKFAATTYKFHFDANGGTGAPGDISFTQANASKTKIPTKTPTRNGYTFNGWGKTADTFSIAYRAGDTVDISVNDPVETTFYAVWTATQYTVTLDHQGGTGASTSSFKAELNGPMSGVINMKLPTRRGYDFGGYFDQPNGQGKCYIYANKSSENWDKESNGTIYAYWIPKTYTVTLSAPDATVAGTDQVTTTSGENMPEATMPTRTGYDFAGYYTAANCGGTKYYNADGTGARTWDIDSNTTLYAGWTEHTATLTYHANGHGTAPDAVTMKYTEAAYAAEMGEVTGYTFNGWNTQEDGNGTSYAAGAELKAANVDPEAIDLYAVWTVSTYTVTLYDNGADECGELTTYTYGEGATLPEPTKTGYTFDGWFENEEFEGDAVEAIATTDLGDKVFYAKWTANTYDVALHGLENATCDPLTSYTYGTGATLPEPTKTGYTFDGWYDNAGFDGDAVEAIATTDLGDKVFYAKWTANTYTVTFDENGGETEADPKTQTVTYDGNYVLPTTELTKRGYIFAGWFTAEDGGEEVTADTTVAITENQTLYAHWQKQVGLSMSLLLDGDTGMKFKVAVNDAALKESLVKDGGYIKVSVGGKGEREEKFSFTELKTDEKGRYLCVFTVNALQMAEKVKIEVCDKTDVVYASTEKSVEEYSNDIIKGSAFGETEKDLVKALVTYGYYAQQAVGAKPEDYAASTAQDEPTTGVETLAGYKRVTNKIATGDDHMKGLSLSLLLNNKTTLCLYLTTTDGEMPKVTVDGGSVLVPINNDETEATSDDDKAPTIEKMSDGRWLVRIPNISALHLADVHKITADEQIIYASAMSYGAATSGKNATAICALYDYYKAALAYNGKSGIASAVAEVSEYDCTGERISPNLTVETTDGQKLTLEKEYTVEWDGDLTNAGKYVGIVKSRGSDVLGHWVVVVKIVDVTPKTPMLMSMPVENPANSETEQVDANAEDNADADAEDNADADAEGDANVNTGNETDANTGDDATEPTGELTGDDATEPTGELTGDGEPTDEEEDIGE